MTAVSLYLVGTPEPSLSWRRGSQLLDDSCISVSCREARAQPELVARLPAAGMTALSLYLVGKPEPSLSWWRGSQLLDDSYEILNGQSVNTVRLEKLGRNDQDVQLSCRYSTVLYTLTNRHKYASI